MRWWLSLSPLLAACTAPAVRIELPEFPGTRAIIVGDRAGTPARAWFVKEGEASVDELPHVQLERGDVFVLTVLGILGDDLPVGLVELADSGLTRTLPRARRTWGTEVTAYDDAAVWRELPGPPATMAELKIAASCPTFERVGPGPVELPAGCPLVAPPRGSICYGEPRRATSITRATSRFRAGENNAVTSFGVEDDVTWAYVQNDRLISPAGNDYTRPGRVRMIRANEADPETLEILPIVPPIEDDPIGWTGGAQVRSDGLEMFLHSSLPDASHWDDDIYHAWRSSISEPWSLDRAGFVTSLSDLENGKDPMNKLLDTDEKIDALLLPDYKTLIFNEYRAEGVRFARRKTTAPDDLDFVRSPVPVQIEEDDYDRLDRFTLSCDGAHVIYTRVLKNPLWVAGSQRPEHIREPRIAKIASFDPLRFEPPSTIFFAGSTAESPYGFPLAQVARSQTLVPAESPDCQAFYVTPDFNAYVSDRIECPE